MAFSTILRAISNYIERFNMTEVVKSSKNRSRRIRKKMRVDEFQELGFDIAWKFEEGTSNDQIDAFLDKFLHKRLNHKV